jgi:hypothetical protein
LAFALNKSAIGFGYTKEKSRRKSAFFMRPIITAANESHLKN